MPKDQENHGVLDTVLKNAETTKNHHTHALFVTLLFISFLHFRIDEKLVAPLVYSLLRQVSTFGFRNNFVATSSSS